MDSRRRDTLISTDTAILHKSATNLLLRELLESLDVLFKMKEVKVAVENFGTESRILMQTYERFLENQISSEELLFDSVAVASFLWERLNIGKWSEVAVAKKEAYTFASYIQVMAVLHQSKPDAIKEAIEIVDHAILLGHPIQGIEMTKVAETLERATLSQKTVSSISVSFKKRSSSQGEGISKRLKLENLVEDLRMPAVDHFYNNYFTKNKPVKLLGCIDHWPAIERWKDMRYIIEKAGHRTVPIELGKHYADESYGQKLMKISDFVNEFFQDDAEQIGYLAQHQLFDQIPELKQDIIVPDYCALSEDPENATEPEINAWFGPEGTVSPLHQDPKHNLLCQVVGTKKILLYPQSDSQYLYPYDHMLWFNTSQVDVENPDLSSFPEFKKATKQECILGPGDVLYIPPKYWHHVRALEGSFSVSFWWK